MRKLSSLKIVLFVAGCMLLVVGASSCSKKAMINDVAVPAELDSGYRVVLVGGEDPKRASHPFITVVPYVEISPGKYCIEIEPKEGDGNRESFHFAPVAETTYRISKTENGRFTLIEDVR